MEKLNENKKFNANNHSMYINTKTTVEKTYRILVGPFNNQTPDFHDMLNELYNAPENSNLELRIISPGGLVVECQQLINIMQNKFKNTTAYIESHASSAGAVIFGNATKRVVYWNSRIMFHNYSNSYKGEYYKIKTRVDFDSKHVIRFLNSVKHYFTKKEWKKLIKGKEYWFDAKEMLERGIATHLILDGKEYEGKEAIKKIKKKFKKL